MYIKSQKNDNGYLAPEVFAENLSLTFSLSLTAFVYTYIARLGTGYTPLLRNMLFGREKHATDGVYIRAALSLFLSCNLLMYKNKYDQSW